MVNSERPSNILRFRGAPHRDDLHLARRGFHIASGVALLLLSVLFPSKRDFAMILGAMTVVDLGIEFSRLLFPRWNAFVLKKFSRIMRAGEERRLSGIAYYLLGCTLAVILFPRDVAVLSIMFLAFGDPVAALVGVAGGKRFWPMDLSAGNKSLEGSFACFLVCGILTLGISYFLPTTQGLLIHERVLFALIGGFSASLGELIPLRTDDNFSMPLISGTTLWVLSAFFQLLPGLYI